MKMVERSGKMTIEINRKLCSEKRDVKPTKPNGKIHIYQGVCGYKFSIGHRHLSLAEMAWCMERINEVV